MDAFAWMSAAVIIAVAIAAIVCAPALHRAHRRRQDAGEIGSMAGVGSGLDAVWRPSAEDAHADWEAQIEVPAPAPSPGDKGRIQGDRIVIRPPVDPSP
ncbi:MAG: hypothetical protein J0I70_13650 [Microbacterium sp.]|uniref:hypothetical protein n=1 Tax=Microbacterium sp. TaxID=51671 RepID=UPI001AC54FAF|nr:hypothetical protein [Microbacterium sp.]MBN9152770.1 hypothetical protein [Microbacterium sp.]MBN9175187.1 hypothetical protein [Microbacterium sp.]